MGETVTAKATVTLEDRSRFRDMVRSLKHRNFQLFFSGQLISLVGTWMDTAAEAKAELERILRQLERINPSAAHSLEEGLEETLTVHRLNVGELLRRTLSSTNAIESCLSTVERVTRNVKRWRGGDQAQRWTATGLLEAEKKFRRVKGYRELEGLHRRLSYRCVSVANSVRS
jgi:putative transposase